jgi:hypothetical protein
MGAFPQGSALFLFCLDAAEPNPLSWRELFAMLVIS